jgi:type IV pilus assembly protein PilO
MRLLPQEQSKQIALLVGVAAVAAFYAVYTYWYSPQRDEIAVLEVHLEQLRARNLQAQVVAARGGVGLEERLAVYERHVERLEQLIPEGEELPTLMNSITLEAQRAGVDLTGLNPDESVPGELYTLQSYEVNVVGDYHPVGRFLTAVASLPRIITPVGLELEVFEGTLVRNEMESPVSATFRVETYVLGGGGAQDDRALEEDEGA